MKLYIAIIEEVILDSEGKPTLELRIRVPNMHYGLKKEFLPIAKPLILPGVIINPEEFINQIERTTRVYVFFEQNNLNRPRYISTTDLPEFLVISTDIEEDGDNTNKLTSPKAVKEYVDAEISNVEAMPGPQGPPGSDATVTKDAVESVLTGDITSHTHNQYLTSHQVLPSISITNGTAETDKYISALSSNGHTITVSKINLPKTLDFISPAVSYVSDETKLGHTYAGGVIVEDGDLVFVDSQKDLYMKDGLNWIKQNIDLNNTAISITNGKYGGRIYAIKNGSVVLIKESEKSIWKIME